MKNALYIVLAISIVFAIGATFFRYMVLGDITYDAVPIEELEVSEE